jgi:1,2-diacylglycerol 3-alpha-glucosyltransferase
MKIVHCCLSNFYIDGYSYQENELVAQNVKDGHDVTVIASTETFGSDRRLAYLEPGEYLGTDGAKVVRLPYRRFLPQVVMRKLRFHLKVWDLLTSLQPDVILFHGTCGWELKTVARFKKLNPDVRLYVDSHEDFHNSAKSWASKWLLHYGYYRVILRKNLKWIEKILCVNMSAISFVNEFYGVPIDKIEFFPLGGLTLDDREYSETRTGARGRYGVSAEQILFVQTGKIDRTKRLLESLGAFTRIEDSRFRFLVAGHLQDDIAEDVQALVRKDDRIRFLGWKTPDELRDLLCAADVYVQPGTQSATMQMSLCCRCAVILDDVPSHKPFMNDNGWLVGRDISLDDAFHLAADSADRLPLMSGNSAAVALRLLDYKSLAARLYR